LLGLKRGGGVVSTIFEFDPLKKLKIRKKSGLYCFSVMGIAMIDRAEVGAGAYA
jgi:hypothetical protein